LTKVLEPPSRRGVQRKTHILRIALQIIGRDGLVHLSMRTLAAEAEIPLGALGYYFDNKDQLIRAAFEAHLDRELRRVMRTTAAIDGAESIDDIARLLAAFLVDGLESLDHELVAEYEFIVEASRRRELARASSAWQQSFRAQLHNTFERLGSPDPGADARLMMAVIAGLEVDNLTRVPLEPAQITDIRRSIERVVTLMSSSWSTPPITGNRQRKDAQ
jgi:DNA-binding transcriptional regulator YbjK